MLPTVFLVCLFAPVLNRWTHRGLSFCPHYKGAQVVRHWQFLHVSQLAFSQSQQCPYFEEMLLQSSCSMHTSPYENGMPSGTAWSSRSRSVSPLRVKSGGHGNQERKRWRRTNHCTSRTLLGPHLGWFSVWIVPCQHCSQSTSYQMLGHRLLVKLIVCTMCY